MSMTKTCSNKGSPIFYSKSKRESRLRQPLRNLEKFLATEPIVDTTVNDKTRKTNLATKTAEENQLFKNSFSIRNWDLWESMFFDGTFKSGKFKSSAGISEFSYCECVVGWNTSGIRKPIFSSILSDDQTGNMKF